MQKSGSSKQGRITAIVVLTSLTGAWLAFDCYNAAQIPPTVSSLPVGRVIMAKGSTARFPSGATVEVAGFVDARPGVPAPERHNILMSDKTHITWDVSGKRDRTHSYACFQGGVDSLNKNKRHLLMYVAHNAKPKYGTMRYHFAGKLDDSIGYPNQSSGDWSVGRVDYVELSIPNQQKRGSLWIGLADPSQAFLLTQTPLSRYPVRSLGTPASITSKTHKFIDYRNKMCQSVEHNVRVVLPPRLRPTKDTLYEATTFKVNAAGFVTQSIVSQTVIRTGDTEASFRCDLEVRPEDDGSLWKKPVAVRVVLTPFDWAEFRDIPLAASETHIAKNVTTGHPAQHILP